MEICDIALVRYLTRDGKVAVFLLLFSLYSQRSDTFVYDDRATQYFAKFSPMVRIWTVFGGFYVLFTEMYINN